MKVGDLVKVSYRDFGLGTLTEPYYGIIFETPEMGKLCVWKMWCFAREAEHIISPSKDIIEVINEANIGD